MDDARNLFSPALTFAQKEFAEIFLDYMVADTWSKLIYLEAEYRKEVTRRISKSPDADIQRLQLGLQQMANSREIRPPYEEPGGLSAHKIFSRIAVVSEYPLPYEGDREWALKQMREIKERVGLEDHAIIQKISLNQTELGRLFEVGGDLYFRSFICWQEGCEGYDHDCIRERIDWLNEAGLLAER
jgi:hypothetical protein